MPDEDFREAFVKEGLGEDFDLDFGNEDEVEGDDVGAEEEVAPEPAKSEEGFKDISLKGGLPQSAEVKPDGKGNLVDAQGNIVARSGKEARLYQDAHKAKSELGQLRLQSEHQVKDLSSRLQRAIEIAKDLDTKYEALKSAGDVASRVGLNEQEHLAAVNLFARMKTDPKGALQQILTQAAASGTDLSQLGLSQSPVDVKSINDLVKQTIDNALNPLRERSERERQADEERRAQEHALQESQRQVEAFFVQNQDAIQYAPVIQQTLERFPGMTLGEVWARIQLNLLRQRENTAGQPRPQGRRSAPLANGEGDEEMAPVSMSYDQIIKEALGKHYTRT